MSVRETVMVIGGAGYIGSHTAKELSTEYNVIVYDNLYRGHKWAVQFGEFIEGDILDTKRLTETLKRYSVKGVFHFAAHSLVGESVSDPLKYWQNNVAGTLSVLEAMKQGKVNHIVFSSTAAVFGEPEEVPINEEARLVPCNPYGATKLTVENILSQCRDAHGLSYSVLRYFNAAGADPDSMLGEDHSPETHLIPLVLDAALGRRKSISIFGDDYDTFDGTCVRDYIHVTDLATAHVLAYKRSIKENSSLSLNLGNGQGYSVRQVIDVVKKTTKVDFTVETAPRRQGDPPSLIASSEKAIRLLGWKPCYNSLEDIVETAWNWHRKHFA